MLPGRRTTANRLELRQRNIDLQLARAGVVRATATNEFRGDLRLSYGIIGNDEDWQNVYETPTRNQDVNISFQIPIYDWGERESRIKAGEIGVQSAELSLSQEKVSIIQGIRRA